MCLITTSLNVMMYLGSWCSTTLLGSISLDQGISKVIRIHRLRTINVSMPFLSIDLSCAEIFHPVVQEDESDDHQE